jgi:hypothetical protein
VRIHPRNPKLFEFRGKPLVLVCATEHYGSVMNRPFRFETYLADAADKAQTLTRLFLLFRELQTPVNPYSPCKPESPDYIAPYRRVGPEKALDGQPKFDLDQWNPEFFERLHRFLSLASGYGIIVEITLLSDTYCEPVWSLNPLHHRNHINEVEPIRLQDYLTQRSPQLFARQCDYVRKIVTEVNRYDNVFFEICNEPSGQEGVADPPSLVEVDAWQMALAGIIRDTEATLPKRHLIAGQQAFMNTGKLFEVYADQAFGELAFDIVNVHPLPNMVYGGRTYQLGDFMSKQLKLHELRAYCLASYERGKPLNLDEDNVASQYKDIEGWTIHRKRAWMTLFCGAHYDYIDFSIINYCEAGTPESQRGIRAWMKHVSEYLHGLDLVRGRPLAQGVKAQPAGTVAAAFGVDGEDVSIYLADARERSEPGAGSCIEGELVVDLPPGDCQVAWYSPVSGLQGPALSVRGGPDTRLAIPAFQHDLVVRLRSRTDPATAGGPAPHGKSASVRPGGT